MEVNQYWTVLRHNDHPILHKDVEASVQSLKKGKSAGVDNIPAKLVKAGGEDIITTLTTICNKIWQTGEWPTPWTQSLVITLPKKGNLQQCQNYWMINQPHQLPKQSHAEDQTEQTIGASGDHCWRTGRLQRRKEHHRADLQPKNPLWEICSSTSKTSTMSSQISRRPLTGFAKQLCGQPWRSTTSVPTLSKSSNTSVTRPLMQSSLMAA